MAVTIASSFSDFLNALTGVFFSLINSVLAVFQAIVVLGKDIITSVVHLAQSLIALVLGLLQGVYGFVAGMFCAWPLNFSLMLFQPTSSFLSYLEEAITFIPRGKQRDGESAQHNVVVV